MADGFRVGMEYFDGGEISNHFIEIPDLPFLSEEYRQEHAHGVFEAMHLAVGAARPTKPVGMILAEGSLAQDQIITALRSEIRPDGTWRDTLPDNRPPRIKGVLRICGVSPANNLERATLVR